MNEVTIRVPATSANLGPGYDCLGVALQIYNRITLRRDDPTPATPSLSAMMQQAAALFFGESKIAPFAFACEIAGEVPPSRGLGSSVTVRLGVLNGLNELSDRPLSRETLFELCTKLEGHPDNAAPAIFGGFTVSPFVEAGVSPAAGSHVLAAGTAASTPARFDVAPTLQFVLLIPNFEIVTADARKVLPDKIAHHDATRNSANACRITAAFASKNYDLLRGAFTDFLHQDYRQPLIPFLDKTIRGAEAAGALGGYLSGSGSTIAALTLRNPEDVAAAMLAASEQTDAQTFITLADNNGAQVFPIDNRKSEIGNR